MYTFAARLCSIYFQLLCYQSSWQTPLLGFSPKTRRKLRLDAIPMEFLNMSTVPSAHHTSKYMDIHLKSK